MAEKNTLLIYDRRIKNCLVKGKLSDIFCNRIQLMPICVYHHYLTGLLGYEMFKLCY